MWRSVLPKMRHIVPIGRGRMLRRASSVSRRCIVGAPSIAEFLQAQRYFQLGVTCMEQTAEPRLYGMQAAFDRVPVHSECGGGCRGVAPGGEVGAQRLAGDRTILLAVERR